MSKCHYCQNELETGEFLDTESEFASTEVCLNEECQVHRIVNLYFKPWFLTKEEIEGKLNAYNFNWKWMGFIGKYFIQLTPLDHYGVREKLEEICRLNGSILFDSEIIYVK